MNKPPRSDRWEVLWLGLLSCLIPLWASLVHLAHLQAQGRSTRYILNNAWISHGREPAVLGVMCVEAILTFVGLLALRRYLRARWVAWVLAICFVALWAFFATLTEAETR